MIIKQDFNIAVISAAVLANFVDYCSRPPSGLRVCVRVREVIYTTCFKGECVVSELVIDERCCRSLQLIQPSTEVMCADGWGFCIACACVGERACAHATQSRPQQKQQVLLMQMVFITPLHAPSLSHVPIVLGASRLFQPPSLSGTPTHPCTIKKTEVYLF